MTPEEIAKMAEIQHRSESNTRRIDKLEQSTEALNSLATSVEVLVNEHKHQTAAMLDIKTDVAKLDKKVETLEHKPSKRWELMIDRIVSALVGGLVGYVLIRLGLG